LNKGECKKVKTLGDFCLNENGGVLGKNNFSRKCKVGWIGYDSAPWIYEKIKSKMYEVNSNLWNFNLDGEMEKLQYLKYGLGEFYAKHMDNSHDDVSCRKLTMVIQLSENYIGGKLKVWGHSKGYAPKEIGSLTVFPSHLFHQANPVFWGKRNVLVCWISGKTPLR
jgi:predicted 2-oxoglutarate/Fe(II)-dependent dioxygenase YbiX